MSSTKELLSNRRLNLEIKKEQEADQRNTFYKGCKNVTSLLSCDNAIKNRISAVIIVNDEQGQLAKKD